MYIMTCREFRRSCQQVGWHTRYALHSCFACFAEPCIPLVHTGSHEQAIPKAVVAHGRHRLAGGWIPWCPCTRPVAFLHSPAQV